MIVYSAIARGTLMLVEYNDSDADFEKLIKDLLIHVSTLDGEFISFEKNDLIITCYRQSDFWFLTGYEKGTSSEIVRRFLFDIADIFFTSKKSSDIEQGARSRNAKIAVQMRELMNELNENPEKFDKVLKLENHLDEMTRVAHESVDEFVERNFKISNVMETTAFLKTKSETFNIKARKIKTKTSNDRNWQKLFMFGSFIGTILLVLYFSFYKA